MGSSGILILILEYSQVLFMIHNLYHLHPDPNHEGQEMKLERPLSEISAQLRFGGGEGMHASGYEESHSPLSVVASIWGRNIKTNSILTNNINVTKETIISVFIITITKSYFNIKLYQMFNKQFIFHPIHYIKSKDFLWRRKIYNKKMLK